MWCFAKTIDGKETFIFPPFSIVSLHPVSSCMFIPSAQLFVHFALFLFLFLRLHKNTIHLNQYDLLSSRTTFTHFMHINYTGQMRDRKKVEEWIKHKWCWTLCKMKRSWFVQYIGVCLGGHQSSFKLDVNCFASRYWDDKTRLKIGIRCVILWFALLLLLWIIRKCSSETESSCHSTFANLFSRVSVWVSLSTLLATSRYRIFCVGFDSWEVHAKTHRTHIMNK